MTNSHVHNIGDLPFNGAQHGLAIYFATVDTGNASTQPTCTTGSTTGTISGNTVDSYQKGGIIAACTGTNVEITNNTVIGAGPVALHRPERDPGLVWTVGEGHRERQRLSAANSLHRPANGQLRLELLLSGKAGVRRGLPYTVGV